MPDDTQPDEPTPLSDMMDMPPDSSNVPEVVTSGDQPEKPKGKPKPEPFFSPNQWLSVAIAIVIILAGIVMIVSERNDSQPDRDTIRLTALSVQEQIEVLSTALAPPEGIVTVTPHPPFTPVPFRVFSSLGAELPPPGPVPSHTGAVPITPAASLDENGCVGNATTTFSPSTPIYIVIESELHIGQTLSIRLYKDDGITEVLRTPSLVVDQDYAHVCASFRFEPQPSAELEKGTYTADVTLEGLLGSTAFTIE